VLPVLLVLVGWLLPAGEPLPELPLSAETGALTEPGSCTETSDPAGALTGAASLSGAGRRPVAGAGAGRGDRGAD